MNTKTSILTALVALASGTGAMAQVYSQNVVGYVNLTMAPGYNLVANQLNASSSNNVNEVIKNVPVESLVLTFANNNYSPAIFDGASWIHPETGDPSTTTLSPGKGFFFFNPGASPLTVTLVGEVQQGASAVPLVPGYNLVSAVVPHQVALTAANNFPQTVEALYLTFANNAYTTYINDGAGWIDPETGDPRSANPAVGQGFFYFNPGNTNQTWARTFNVN
jgi:hypothetical protein